MSDNLLERHVEQLRLTGGDLADLCQPLADAIEAVTAERDGLLRCVTDNHVALCRAEKAEAERDRLREALAPSGATKAAYLGEFHFSQTMIGDDGNDVIVKTYVPWTTVKEIMAAILARAALKGETP